MTIQLYAALKDFFGKELKIDQAIASVNDLQRYLESKNPASAAILRSCRFAVNNEFVSPDFLLDGHEHISVIPPSSGG